MIENIPKIKKTFDTIYNFVQILEKTYDKFQTTKTNVHRNGKFAVKGAQYTVYPTGTSQTPPVDQHKANSNNEQPRQYQKAALGEIYWQSWRNEGHNTEKSC